MTEPSNDSIPAAEWRIAEQLAREARRNIKFNAMPAAKKRVALAKDVLKWLVSGKLRAAGQYSGGGSTYLEFEDIGKDGVSRYVTVEERKAAGKVNGYSCKACALGSLFAVAVERDSCTLFAPGERTDRASDDVTAIWSALGSESGLFDLDQMLLIERAYEGSYVPSASKSRFAELHGQFADSIENDDWTRAGKLAGEVGERAERLRLIMENIIANAGTFVP